MYQNFAIKTLSENSVNAFNTLSVLTFWMDHITLRHEHGYFTLPRMHSVHNWERLYLCFLYTLFLDGDRNIM
jgi:hypothetical protein